WRSKNIKHNSSDFSNQTLERAVPRPPVLENSRGDWTDYQIQEQAGEPNGDYLISSPETIKSTQAGEPSGDYLISSPEFYWKRTTHHVLGDCNLVCAEH